MVGLAILGLPGADYYCANSNFSTRFYHYDADGTSTTIWYYTSVVSRTFLGGEKLIFSVTNYTSADWS